MLEARETIGGGMRTAELTLPGFQHDVCSAVHPLAISSPFFKSLPLQTYGLEWLQPEIPLAHPLDDGSAVALYRSIDATVEGLAKDGEAYRQLIQPLVDNIDKLLPALLGPFQLPRHPILMARFGLLAARPARSLARSRFTSERARGFFAGLSAHSILPLDKRPSAAFGMILAMLGHAAGWPVPKGGSQQIADATAGYLKSIGGEIRTGVDVQSMADVPPAHNVLFDITPRQLLEIAGDRFSRPYRRQLERYRYGPGIFKLDYALDGPVPWLADECQRAGTVHLGGTLDEIAASERLVAMGRHPAKPFVIVTQASLVDHSRAPAGKHTLWAYCHVPNGSTADMTGAIERQIERFAPGFSDLVLARHTMGPQEFQRYNPNYIGGDINGGIQDLGQLFTRPVISHNPYRTSDPSIYLCSSSTPPGGGVHGMCGYHAARSVR